jgi:hypothetical protein
MADKTNQQAKKLNTPRVAAMKALVIYDDLACAEKANAALQHSAQNANVGVQWNIRPWRVDMLKFPPTAEEALAEALDAHLIVFVGRRAQSFSFWLQDWLELWSKCRQTKDAVLAVIGVGNAEGMSSQSELSQFARRHGLSVIFDGHGVIEDSLLHAEPLNKPKPDVSPFMPLTLDKRTQDSYRGWGINE